MYSIRAVEYPIPSLVHIVIIHHRDNIIVVMSSYMAGKDIQALVVDIGSFSTKIGYAGDDHPQAVYHSTTAVERGSIWSNFARGPKRDFSTRCINNNNSGGGDDGNYDLANPVDPVTGWIFSPPSRSCAGRRVLNSNSNSSSSSSFPSSENSNTSHRDDHHFALGDEWECHELVNRYLQHAFHNALGLGMRMTGGGDGITTSSSITDDHVSHHPLLLLDKPHTPPALRQRMLEILFEAHHLPAAFFLRDAVASCYAVGRTTATVVDVGHSATMVSPVYEGFVESRGVLRNNACGARYVDERILAMMDEVVKKQGGRRRKDRMRRTNQRRLEQKNNNSAASASGSHASGPNTANHATESNSPSKQQQHQQPRTASSTLKRDAAGHFIKDSSSNNNNLSQSLLAPIPDYLMPLYQVRRAPTYDTRSDPFHNWARITLAREIKEMGLGVAVGPMGYVSSAAASAAAVVNATTAAAGGGTAEGGGTTNIPTSTNNVFLTSSKLPYTLPDGTPVEITTASRCDVAELFFGNDDFNNNYRDNIFDETVQRMEEYEKEIEDFLIEGSGGVNGGGGGGEGGVELSSRKPSSGGEAGDAYSNTSYRGEKPNRHSVRGGRRRIYYPPSTVSKKLYSACLPYIRTTPPNIHNSDGMDAMGGSGGGGGLSNVVSSASGTGANENYFHYLTSASPAQMVCDAVFRCDRDQQASLLGNVVVCGGGSCITGVAGVGAMAAGGPLGVGGSAPAGSGAVGGGVMASLLGDEHAFPDRLREEIEAIVHRHTPGWRIKVTSPNISERAICSWLGGSILGSLSTFQDMWISRKDYEEYGAAIVNRKCP